MKLRFSHWLKKGKRKHISRGGSITFTKTTEDSYVIRKNKGCAVPQSLHLSCVHNCSSSHYVNENISWLNETQQTVTVHSTKNTTELPELTAPLMDIYDYKTCSFDKSLTWSLICYQNPFIRQVQLTYRCLVSTSTTDIHCIRIQKTWYRDKKDITRCVQARRTDYTSLYRYTHSGMQSVAAGGRPCKWSKMSESDEYVIYKFWSLCGVDINFCSV